MNRINILIITTLLLVVGLLSYFLYQDGYNASEVTKKNAKSINNITLDNPNKDLNKATLNNNIKNLKKMLSKTQAMLKSHNIDNPNTIISNSQIDKLVNLDLEDTKKENKIINYESNKNLDIKNEETISNIDKEKINNNEISKTTQSSKQTTTSSTTTTSSSNTIEETPVKEDTKQVVDENTQVITDKNVQIEVKKLKTQIADVKKTIEKISSNIQ